MYHGDIRLGDTIDIKFTTRRFSTGAPFTLAGTPSVAAYPSNSTTEITAGITLTVDFDARTGLNNVRVVATGGNGYVTATNYTLVITAGTVDSVSVVGECVGSFSIEARSALMPTTAARTLDVSAGGEAGLDWANIGSPTTAQNLSATNIDVDQIVASVSGAVGSVTGNVGGNVVGSVGSVAAGGITAASIATNAIDADALAADAVAEIADGVWDEDATGHQTQGTFGQVIGDSGADADSIWGLANTNLDATVSSRASAAQATAIQADTDDIQTRLPAALVGGRMDSSVGAMAANTLTAAALAADAVAEIQAAILSDATPFAGANIDVAISTRATPAQVNAEVLDVLAVDAFAEPTGVPPATDTLSNKIGRVHQALRNQVVVNSNTAKKQFFDDAGVALWEKDLTDAGGIYTETEGNAP